MHKIRRNKVLTRRLDGISTRSSIAIVHAIHFQNIALGHVARATNHVQELRLERLDGNARSVPAKGRFTVVHDAVVIVRNVVSAALRLTHNGELALHA